MCPQHERCTMPYSSRGNGSARRPSPLLVLTGSACVALGLIGLGLSVVDDPASSPGALPMKAAAHAVAKVAPGSPLAQQLASARTGH
jgi:hypothetical protein